MRLDRATAFAALALGMCAGCPPAGAPPDAVRPSQVDYAQLARAADMALDLTDYSKQELSAADLRARYQPDGGALEVRALPDVDVRYMVVYGDGAAQNPLRQAGGHRPARGPDATPEHRARGADATVTLVLPGTVSLANIALGLEAEAEWDAELGARVHGGFRRVALAVRADLAGLLAPHARVRCVGYSMGAAAAVVVAAYLQLDGHRIEEVLTFGQPRLTDAAGAAAFTTLPLLRVITLEDPVATRPRGEYAQFGIVLVLLEGSYVVWLQPGDAGYLMGEVPQVELTETTLRSHAQYRERLAGKVGVEVTELTWAEATGR